MYDRRFAGTVAKEAIIMIARLNTNRSLTLVSAFVIALMTLIARPVKAIAYDSPEVARLSGIVDEAYVLGEGDTEWSYAEPNLIIERGDGPAHTGRIVTAEISIPRQVLEEEDD